MTNIRLLDCTLRDGGYLNDWEFGYDTIVSVFERLVASGVDIIEVGFLDDRRQYDINRTIFPDTISVNKSFNNLSKGKSMIVGMIDFGTCGIDHISPCNESYLDGIRVIFKEHLMYDALDFCDELGQLGYSVFAQMVSVTTYTDEKLKELAHIAGEKKIDAVSIVDTYGLLHQTDLLHIFHVLDENLATDMTLGYHAHNNFQMGYANCISIIQNTSNRKIVVDGTLYGMGKSAGNAPIELLAMYLNEYKSKKYDVPQLLEAIDNNILSLHRRMQWGYNILYYVSASMRCHPNYVSFLMEKATLSMQSIITIIERIPLSERLLYHRETIEKLYLHYQQSDCNDEGDLQALTQLFADKTLVLLGPGPSVRENRDGIRELIQKKNTITVSVNYLPQGLHTDYVFLSNSKRYIHMQSKFLLEENRHLKIVATSNLLAAGGTFDYVVGYEPLIDQKEVIPDNSFVMLLRLMIKLGVKTVKAAGFDGYSDKVSNYYHPAMEYDFIKEKAEYLNQYTRRFLEEHKEINVEFVTNTKYKENM